LLGQLFDEGGAHESLGCGGHHDAAHGGALLAGLVRHLLDHVVDEHRQGIGAFADVRTQHRGVERVGLDVDGHVVRDDLRMAADGARGVARTGEDDGVLRPDVVQQVARGPGKQREHAGWQQVLLLPQLGDPHGGRGRSGARLGEHGNACQQRTGQLLAQVPRRKVEGIDVDRHAQPRSQDVLPQEPAGARDADLIAIEQKRLVAQRLT